MPSKAELIAQEESFSYVRDKIAGLFGWSGSRATLKLMKYKKREGRMSIRNLHGFIVWCQISQKSPSWMAKILRQDLRAAEDRAICPVSAGYSPYIHQSKQQTNG